MSFLFERNPGKLITQTWTSDPKQTELILWLLRKRVTESGPEMLAQW